MALETALGTDMPAVPGVKSSAPKPLDLKAPKTSAEAIQAQMGLIPKAAEAEGRLKGAELSMETGIQGAKAEAARETSDKANAEKRRIDEQLDKWPYPEFHPTQDNAQSMGGLFSLVATMGMMLGSSGKLSAQNAMGAMTGMLDGWKKGRQDLYTREKQNFDTEVARIKTIHDDLKSRFDEYMKLLPLDREAAALEKEQLVRLAGQGSVLSAYIEKGQFDQARQLLAGVEKQLEKVEDEKRRAAERFETRREAAAARQMYKQTEITLKDGTKVPAVFEEHTGQYRDLNGRPVDVSQIRSIVDVGTGSGARTSASNQRFAFNMAGSFGQIKNDLVGITKLKQGTTLGTFGELAGQSGDTLVKSLESRFGRALTSTDQQEFAKLVASFDARMATLLGGGYAGSTAKGLRDAYMAQVAKEGESPRSQALFLARARQELEEWANNFEAYPSADEAMQGKVRQNLELVRNAIPWTVDDVLSIGVKPGEKTIGKKFADALAKTPSADIQPLPTFNSEAEAKAARDSGQIKNGDEIIVAGQHGNWHD